MSNQTGNPSEFPAWFESYKTGDDSRYHEVFDLYYRSIYYYTQQKLGEGHPQLDDIVNSAFTKAWDNRHKIKSPRHLNNFLYKVAFNLSITYFRTNTVFRQKTLDYTEYFDETHDDTSIDLDRVQAELIAKIHDLLKQVPNGHVLKMIYVEGLSTREIATKLNVTENNVYIMKSRALKQLRKRLGNDMPIVVLLASLALLTKPAHLKRPIFKGTASATTRHTANPNSGPMSPLVDLI